jgi:predicted AlkP superfamily pyrophosphatase or phosphodiesterase
MMGTHGPLFSPEKQNFSTGKTQDENWMEDFYDDSILTFDNYIGEIIKALEQSDKFDNTILIVYSDHPMVYDIRLRVPLLIHFPNNQHAGQITTNTQNLDIAPTILDYMGIQQPQWMEGRSLLKDESTEKRLIFNSGTSYLYDIGQGKNLIASARVKPPFFQFTLFNVIDCQKWYRLDLIAMTWDSGIVPGHTNPCAEDDLLSMDQIKDAFAEYLSSHGFDTSSLP